MVTFDGEVPPAQMTLNLEGYDGNSWQTLQQTDTTANGAYLFTNVPPLGRGQAYRVTYYNPADGKNAGYLWNWLGAKLETYLAGGRARGGDFDVVDVRLASPDDAASLQLPADFCWTPRGSVPGGSVPGDVYKLMIYSLRLDATWSTPWLGAVSCVTLTALPEEWPNGGTYAWWVRVGKGPNPDAAPYNRGDSYEDRLATISW